MTASKRSLFCKKAPQKTFVTLTRDVEKSPGPQGQKFFAPLFFKNAAAFSSSDQIYLA
jgi:hypothetical protein